MCIKFDPSKIGNYMIYMNLMTPLVFAKTLSTFRKTQLAIFRFHQAYAILVAVCCCVSRDPKLYRISCYCLDEILFLEWGC